MGRKIPVVGDHAPDFAAYKADGQRFRLYAALAEGQNVMLTFYRGHW